MELTSAGVGNVGGEHMSITVAQQVMVRATDRGSRGSNRRLHSRIVELFHPCLQ